MGWGPLAWKRRPPANGPGPLACTAELSGLSHGRPRPWPWLSPCSCEGFGVPAQMQLGDFLCLFWLRSPRFSPRGQAVAGGGSIHLPPRHTPTPSQSQAPLRGLAASQGHQNAQNPDGCVVLSGTPQAQVCSCRPHPLPTTPRLGTLALLLLPPQTPPLLPPSPHRGPDNVRPQLGTPSCPPPTSPCRHFQNECPARSPSRLCPLQAAPVAAPPGCSEPSGRLERVLSGVLGSEEVLVKSRGCRQDVERRGNSSSGPDHTSPGHHRELAGGLESRAGPPTRVVQGSLHSAEGSPASPVVIDLPPQVTAEPKSGKHSTVCWEKVPTGALHG